MAKVPSKSPPSISRSGAKPRKEKRSDPKSSGHSKGKHHKSESSSSERSHQSSAAEDAAAYANIQQNLRSHVSTDQAFERDLVSMQDRTNSAVMRMSVKEQLRDLEWNGPK